MDESTADLNRATGVVTTFKRFLRTRFHTQRPTESAGVGDVDSNVPKADPYAALRDIDVFGQKSDDGVNRTDDPSRGPIE
jgi:hypothetical protein